MAGLELKRAITNERSFNYHGQMKKLLVGIFCSLCLVGSSVWAQNIQPSSQPSSQPSGKPLTDVAASEKTPALETSKLDAELFYRLLIGEITTAGGDPAAGFALMLDSARRTNDATL